MKKILIILFITFLFTGCKFNVDGLDLGGSFNLTDTYLPMANNNSLIDSGLSYDGDSFLLTSQNSNVEYMSIDYNSSGGVFANQGTIDFNFNAKNTYKFATLTRLITGGVLGSVYVCDTNGDNCIGFFNSAKAFATRGLGTNADPEYLNFGYYEGRRYWGAFYASSDYYEFRPSNQNSGTKTLSLGSNLTTDYEYKFSNLYLHDNANIYLGHDEEVKEYYNGTDRIIDNQNNGDTHFINQDVYINGNIYADNLNVSGSGSSTTGYKLQYEGADAVTSQTIGRYLDLHNGLQMASNRGHTMIRNGSITGISGNVNINSFSAGANMSVQARINGVNVFEQKQSVSSTGRLIWSGTQPRYTDNFTINDVLTIYVDVEGTLSYSQPVANVEVFVNE